MERTALESSELLDRFISDTTQWDLMTGEELESRICTYESTGDKNDFFRALSCLRLTPLYFLRVKGKKSSFYVSSGEGDFYPVFTSKKQAEGEDKKKYACAETDLRSVCEFLEGEQSFKGIVINYKTTPFIVNREILFLAMKSLDEAEEKIDELMEHGISEELLTDMLFERFNGRKVSIETKDGVIIEGETGIHYKDETEHYIIVEPANGEERKVHKSEVKKIKALPIE